MREFIIIVSSFYYFTAIATRIVFKWLTVFLFIIVFFHFCIGFSRGFYGHVTDCLCQNQYNMYHSKVNLCNFAGILTWHAVRTFLEKIRFSLKRETLSTLGSPFISHYKRSLRFGGYIKLSHSSIIRPPKRLWNRDVKVYRDNIAWIMDYRSASMNARALSISGKIVL